MSATIEQLTVGVTGPALLATGVQVEIYVARPDDLDSVRTFYEELSDTSTYFRFFGIRRALPDNELRSVVTPAWPERLTLCAAVDGRLIGVGELVAGSPEEIAESGDAELAFAVADDHHREGVATLLLEALAIVARRSGFPRLTASRSR